MTKLVYVFLYLFSLFATQHFLFNSQIYYTPSYWLAPLGIQMQDNEIIFTFVSTPKNSFQFSYAVANEPYPSPCKMHNLNLNSNKMQQKKREREKEKPLRSRCENMAKLYANYAAAWRGEQPSSHSKLPVKFSLTSFWPNQIA